jgi:Xaa-Pro aminopeptidase
LPVLCHGRTISDEFLFPVEEYKAREDQVKAILDAKNLDGLIIYSDGLSRGNVCYLTNYHVFLSWGSAVLVFPRNGKPVLLATLPPRDLVFTKKSIPDFVEIIPVGLSLIYNHHLTIGTIDYMKEKNLLGGKWGGVNLDSLPTKALAPIIEKFPDIPDCTRDYYALKEVKDDKEQYAMEQAATISARAANEFLRLAVEGVSEIELSAQIERMCKMNGVDNASFLVSSGSEGTNLQQPCERIFQKGDTVSVFVNIQYQRHKSNRRSVSGSSRVIETGEKMLGRKGLGNGKNQKSIDWPEKFILRPQTGRFLCTDQWHRH